MSNQGSSIPKFGSFKAKPSTPESQSEAKQGNTTTNHRKDGNRRLESRYKHQHDLKSREVRNHAGVQEQAALIAEAPSNLDLYIVDKKGDANNAAYGDVNRWAVPTFRRYGTGNVIGARTLLKIDREYDESKGLVLSANTEHMSLGKRDHPLSQVMKYSSHLLQLREDAPRDEDQSAQADYLPVTSTQHGETDTANDHDHDEEDRDYRTIYGKSTKHNQSPGDNFVYVQDMGSIDDLSLDPSVRQRNQSLLHAVEQQPSNTQAWIALIMHQDRLLQGSDGLRKLTQAEMSSTAEIKIHLYEKALKHVKPLQDRERMLLGLMEEGAKVWEKDVQATRWSHISRQHHESPLLWQKYLDFIRTSITTFKFDDCRSLFAERIMQQVQSLSSSDQPHELGVISLIDTLLRYTIFIRESGYTELAVAAWQVLLEYNFMAPGHLAPTEYVASFQDFWDSEVPRFGEPDSRGWCEFVQKRGPLAVPPERSDAEPQDLLPLEGILSRWAWAERARHQESLQPARTMDDVVENDPHRVILFSDIESFLIHIPLPKDTEPNLLIDAYLIFCRLPPVGSLGSPDVSRQWFADSSIRGELLEVATTYLEKQSKAQSNQDREDVTLPDLIGAITTETMGTDFVSDTETMFSATWPHRLYVWRGTHANVQGPFMVEVVHRTLRQLLNVYPRETFAEYILALEWHHDPDRIRKTARVILKMFPASLRLYNAYAMIEWARGKKELANSTWSAALMMHDELDRTQNNQTNAKATPSDTVLLHKSRVWACLEDHDKQNALLQLVSMQDMTPRAPSPPTATSMLKAKSTFMEHRDSMLLIGNYRHAALHAECLALLQYLCRTSSTEPQSTDQGDIGAALESISTSISLLRAKDPTQSTLHELLLQSAARMLSYHVQSGPFRPSFLRDRLLGFLAAFPSNTIFLTMFEWNEARFRIDQRMRSLLTTMLLSPEHDCLTSRIFAIRHEIKYGTVHSALSSFEHAINSSVGRSSPAIWKFYIVFCTSTPSFQQRAKDVWIRAINACPWVKELFILGFEILQLDMKQAMRIWRVMGEKDLRIHVDLEDILDL